MSHDNDYAGGLSTLTRYGTMNVSTSRIPRKKRSRGNIAQPRTRTVALTDCVCYDADGNVTRIIPRNARTAGPRTRKPNRATIAAAPHRITAADLAPIGNVE